MNDADLLIHSAPQIATCASNGPKRGNTMRDPGLLTNAAIAVKDGTIVAVGPSDQLRQQYQAAQEIDASGHAICPGFVDPHTHVVYAGDRVAEFEQRIAGATYLEIMAAGGGILSTMKATRTATIKELVAQTTPRLTTMLTFGTTTAEAKTGYGLEQGAELRQLQATALLDQVHPIDLVPTFLAAHAIPPEYRSNPDHYVDLIINEMLPAAMAWYHSSHFAEHTPFFADVFCEQNAFNLSQSQQVLEAAHALGFKLKAHVDEFTNLGGVAMAIALGATSVDHLDVSSESEFQQLAQSETIAIVIPTVTFHLAGSHYANARGLIDTGAALALTTDINPGSAPCPSMPFAMAIACRYQRLLPAEALVASTINAAYAIGLGERIGSIEPGKQADLLLINTADYRFLMYEFGANPIQQVIKRGMLVTN